MKGFAAFLRKTALWILLLPLACTFVGAASNQLVLWANNDTFPVKLNLVKAQKMAPDAVEMKDGTTMLDDVHCLMTSKTHLNLLADNWDFHDGIESVGDLLLGLGAWLGTFCPFVWGFALIQKAKNAI